MDKSIIKRFWSKVDKSDECWEWNASTTMGYGMMSVGNKNQYAHRISWELHNGEIPHHDSYHGMCVLHACDNTLCVRPDHLFLGIHQDNMMDMLQKGRAAIGESHGNARLTEEKVREIRMWRNLGYTVQSIAEAYKVHAVNISYIANRTAWKHVLP